MLRREYYLGYAYNLDKDYYYFWKYQYYDYKK